MAALLYILALCLANFLVFWLGPWWSPVNSFMLIGLDLSLRDALHERYGLAGASALALLASGLSWLLNPAVASIALASAVSFALANVADGTAYQALMRHPRLVKASGSNMAGATVDSLVFPYLAFGELMPGIMGLQFAAKVSGGFLWSLILIKPWRASL